MLSAKVHGGLRQIVDSKGDVRNDFDALGRVAVRLGADPLDPERAGLKTGDVNPVSSAPVQEGAFGPVDPSS